MPKDRKKADVLNDLLCLSQTSCSPGTQPLELEERVGEQREASTIPGEMVSDLLHHLETHTSVGSEGIHLKALRELVQVLTEHFNLLS